MTASWMPDNSVPEPPGTQSAFTLSEWLVTISLVAFLATVGIPGFEHFVQVQIATTTMNGIANNIRFTRVSAIQRNSIVTLCPRGTAERCGDLWHDGAIIFIDENGSGQRDEEEEVLRIHPPLPDGSRLLWRSFGNKPYLQMNARGTTRRQNGNFQYCPANADPRYARQVIVHTSGRIRMAQDNDGDGIREDSQNRPLTCNT